MLSACGPSLLKLTQGHGSIVKLLSTKLPTASVVLNKNASGMSDSKSYELRHQEISERTTASKWRNYRILSLGLLGGCIGCLAMPGNAVIDFFTVTLLVHHNHFGVSHMLADYVPLFFGRFGSGVINALLLIVSVLTLALLYSFNYHGAGFSRSVSGFFRL